MKKDEDEYGNEQADTTLEKSRLQALIKPILLTTVFLLACGLLYTEAEGWDFGVACYFWFITFSTIGLGDFAPAHENQIGTVVLITIGLALLSAALNAIQEYISSQETVIVHTYARSRGESMSSAGSKEEPAGTEEKSEAP